MQKMPMNSLNNQNHPPMPYERETKRVSKVGTSKKKRQSAVRGSGDNTLNDEEEQQDTVGELGGGANNNIFYQSMIHVELPDDRTLQD